MKTRYILTSRGKNDTMDKSGDARQQGHTNSLLVYSITSVLDWLTRQEHTSGRLQLGTGAGGAAGALPQMVTCTKTFMDLFLLTWSCCQ